MTRRATRPFWLGEDTRTWDHVRIHVQLYKDPRIDAYHLGVYGGIACHADAGTGEADPAAKTLAGYVGCGDRKVRDALNELQKWRYIDILERPGDTSIYRLLPPPPLPETPAPGAAVTPASQTAVAGTAVSQGALSDLTAGPQTAVSGAAVPGAAHPGTSDRGVRTDAPRTPARGADELEQKQKTFPNGGGDAATPNAGEVLAEVLKPDVVYPGAFKGHLGKEIKKLLDEGFPFGDVVLAATKVVSKGLHPSTLPSVLVEVRSETNGHNGYVPSRNPDLSEYEGAIQ